MNYLAHAVLSGADNQVMAGNLLADQIKGRLPSDLPPRVILGIRLHRRLDAHTDNHPIFKRSRARVSTRFGHVSGIVVDVVYDHILARNMETYTAWTLDEFVEVADSGFDACRALIPNYLSPRWSGLKWLRDYADEAGIERAFSRIVSRARRPLDFGDVLAYVRPHLTGFEEDFSEFFPTAVDVQDKFLLTELPGN